MRRPVSVDKCGCSVHGRRCLGAERLRSHFALGVEPEDGVVDLAQRRLGRRAVEELRAPSTLRCQALRISKTFQNSCMRCNVSPRRAKWGLISCLNITKMLSGRPFRRRPVSADVSFVMSAIGMLSKKQCTIILIQALGTSHRLRLGFVVKAKDGLVDFAQGRLWCRAVEELQINFEKEIIKNVESSAAMLPQNPMQKVEESRRMPKKNFDQKGKRKEMPGTWL